MKSLLSHFTGRLPHSLYKRDKNVTNYYVQREEENIINVERNKKFLSQTNSLAVVNEHLQEMKVIIGVEPNKNSALVNEMVPQNKMFYLTQRESSCL